ncbi:hypothetical protein [Fusobacterium varium]
MKIVIDLGGTQTDTHCSISSSINACSGLSFYKDKCKMFGVKLEYDYDSHSYKRCEKCIASEYK